MHPSTLAKMLLEGRLQKRLILPRKGWILPGGQIVNCRQVWHYEWLWQNRAWLAKEHGIRLRAEAVEGETPVRLEAMRAGMFRIGNDDGRMVVQGMKARFSRVIRDVVLELALDNRDASSVFVSLLRPDGSAAAEKLVDIDRRADVCAQIPFCESQAAGMRIVQEVLALLNRRR